MPPLTTETIWAILKDEISDDTVNQLVWRCLGYSYDEQTNTWNSTNVASDWQEEYPEPPDFIASRPATVKLTRSISPENKVVLQKI